MHIIGAKSDLSDSHPKKHHFHFPTIHLPWTNHIHHHKRTGSHKKDREGDLHILHSQPTSDHENDLDRIIGPIAIRRSRESESQPHRRHTLAHRIVGPLLEAEIPMEPNLKDIVNNNYKS